MKTELINGIEVTIIEDPLEMLKNIDAYPIMFNVKCNDRTITTTSGFESCVAHAKM